jgi:hypothetical protein
VVETLTGIPYAVSDPTIVQLKLAQSVDVVPVPDDLTLEARGSTPSPAADLNVSLRWSRGLALWPYFLENTRVQ